MFWLIFLVALIFLLPLAYAGKSLAPWAPTFRRDVDRIVGLAAVKPGEIWYELGSGDGRVTRALARSGARVRGLEFIWYCHLWAVLREKFQPTGVTFQLGDFYQRNLSAAAGVYFFGHPSTMARLTAKLTAELKPGTRVISYSFAIPGWQPKTIDRPMSADLPIYLYIV